MDQTAMPIMLGWKLWKAGVLSDEDLEHWYVRMLKPAAEFLANGGHVRFSRNCYHLVPPDSQQERWEEQHGYSPSTVAAIITGLLAARNSMVRRLRHSFRSTACSSGSFQRL